MSVMLPVKMRHLLFLPHRIMKRQKPIVFYITCFQPHQIDIFSNELEDFGENRVIEGIVTMMACRLFTKAAIQKHEICDCCKKILRQNIGDDGWALDSHHIFSCSHVICTNCFSPENASKCPFCLETAPASFIEETIAVAEKM